MESSTPAGSTNASEATPVGTHQHPVGPLLVATAGRDAPPVILAARLVAEKVGAAVEVVAVVEPVPILLPGIGMDAMLPAMDAEQRRRLTVDVTESLRSGGVDDGEWPLEVVSGPAARTIARLAEERRSRMIVMGIGRHAPMDRLLGSETALQTIRLADRPVLAVSPVFGALPRHAAVAMDFSPASVRAAEEALALLVDGGTLSLVYVRPRDIDLVRVGDEVLSWQHGDQVNALFESVVTGLAVPASCKVRLEVVAGEPAEQVIEFAEREGVDLVATGSSGLGFFDRLIVGSVATRILRGASVSVLVVPRPSAAHVERIEQQLAGTAPRADG